MVMNATVIQIRPRSLLVNDLSSNQDVLVHFNNANRFSVGDNVRITHNGRMTRSIPPQITANSIRLVPPPNPPRPPQIQPPLLPTPPQQSVPAETRAIVTQRGREFLMVRDLQNNRQMRVNFVHAQYFCVGQRIIIRHDTIIMNNPPEINAIEIIPLC